ncbi:type II toxin-antitoxin system RelE/ParE family toxin [Agrobacterium sp. rho-13.3]|uniref:type II toxin-antitoxin system RelE/ParE family toxin n=1 Tax=Agrobacterium sp. rho-13.3 TaxID=3072980 RepID=UPI002A17F566|nr:type II toxin-antitoxin system RelE/ParE family toxin [Agrobacterium sp. rho-13.3]MDX8308764.1 type II toxin-antitoxin system RelE/ParE family toxin [Agrobacterium sp. rho-13.3]
MVYEVIRSGDSERDLGLIFDHLVEAYVSLGDDLSDALERAAERLRALEDQMELIGETPYQGTLLPNLSHGLRNVTKNQAIFYFEVSEEEQQVRILAVFFGGQDHQRHMLARLGKKTA